MLLWLVIIIGLLVLFGIRLNPECREISGVDEGEFVMLSEGRVWYELTGKETGDLVVLVHGFGTPSGVFKEMVGVLNDAGYRVLRYDLFGRGYSERLDLEYHLDHFVKQLEDLLESLALTRPFSLIGLSMGGTVSAAFGAANPKRVRNSVLMAPLVASTDIGLLRYSGLVKVVGPLLARLFPRRQMAGLLKPKGHPDIYEMVSGQMEVFGTTRGLISIARNIARLDHHQLFEKWGESQIPTLILWGSQDPVVPFSEHEIACELTGAVFKPVPGAGHLALCEKPDEVHEHILKFLRE